MTAPDQYLALPGAALSAPSTQALDGHVHRRYNPLLDEWILVSAGRTSRPWSGETSSTATKAPSYDPMCYLCPTNLRASGTKNPDYHGTFVFLNDYPALTPESGAVAFRDELFRAEPAIGTCRVICYTQFHDRSLGDLSERELHGVVDTWASESFDLGRLYRWVQVFENRGAAMGASNPHPHGQVWAGKTIPRDGIRENATQRSYFKRFGRTLLEDYVSRESGGARVVEENARWVAVVPFWAIWPFETLLVPRYHVANIPDLSAPSRSALSEILSRLMRRYDGLFSTPFPYSLGWHQAPFVRGHEGHWMLHAHIYPPLLRSSTIRKFMVGYELLSEAQRDLTAEASAVRLREVAPARSG